MRAKIEFEVDNAAFEDDQEIGRVLVVCANKIREWIHNEAAPVEAKLRDVNGNTIGKVELG